MTWNTPLTDLFGVRYPIMQASMLDIAYERRVALIVYTMKLQPGRTDEAHEPGIKVMTLVGTGRHAVRAQERGADDVIATGVASALALGAAEVWVGTRFMATREAQVHQAIHKEIMDRSEDQTVISRALSGKTFRLATNNFTAYWADREIKPFPQQAIEMNKLNYVHRSLVEGDVLDCPLPMGQSTGLIDDILGADEVVDNLVREAEETVRTLTEVVGAPERVAR